MNPWTTKRPFDEEPHAKIKPGGLYLRGSSRWDREPTMDKETMKNERVFETICRFERNGFWISRREGRLEPK
jgi:hypothetical protein